MAATALDIVSVPDMKEELRIPGATTSQDALLKRQIESAVSYCQHSLRAPLVDVVDVYRLTPVSGTTAPLIFAAPALKSVENLEYWTPAGSKIDDPDGSILPADLGRLVHELYDWQTHALYPTSSGWPETLPDTVFLLSAKRGIDITPETAALRSATILLVRTLYDGYRAIRSNEAFLKILQPFKSRGYIARRGEISPSLETWLAWQKK